MPPQGTDHLIDIDAVERMSRPEVDAHAKALRTINAITDVMLSAADPRDALGRAVESILRFTRFPAVAVYERVEPPDRLEMLFSRGLSEKTARTGHFVPLEGSLGGAAVRRREILVVPDMSRDPRTEPALAERLREEGFSAAAIVPLLVGDRAVGVMDLIYKGELGLTEYERNMLTSIGRTLAQALECANFVETLEQERQYSEATLRSIGDAVVATDERTRVTFMNPQAERLTAWAQDEALSHPVEEIFRLHDARTREPIKDPVARSLHDRAVVHHQADVVLTARNGRELEVSDNSAPIIDSHGNALGAVLAFRDVSEARRNRDWLEFMHQADLLLARSLDYDTTLRQVALLAVASLADVCGIDMLRPDGSIRRLAGAHTDPSKQPLADTVVRLSHLDPHAPEGAPKAIRTRQPLLYTFSRDEPRLPGLLGELAGSSDPEFIEALRRLDLSSAIIVPLVAGEETLGALDLCSRAPHRFVESDIQRAQQLAHLFSLHIENARLHREVQGVLAVREDFLSLASHELKTPITSLQLDLQVMKRAQQAGGDPAMAAKLARATHQVERLANLSQSLLDFVMLSGGSVVLQLNDADLREVVAQAVARCAEEARRAKSPIVLRAGPQVPVRCDKAWVEQAVTNLITNAIKFGKSRPIDLAVESKGATARITVADHGIGVPPEDRRRIFELFERAVAARHYGGLGLGLYVAREVAHAHAGSILVATEPDAGSTFTILLPKRGPAEGLRSTRSGEFNRNTRHA